MPSASRCPVAGPPYEPRGDDVARAAELVAGAERAVILAGNGAVRAHGAPALRAFSDATGIPVAETFMGKGLIDAEAPGSLGAVGLQSGDFAMAGFEDADLVITVGFDLVEHSPELWNPRGNKRILCIDSVPAETDEHFVPEIKLVGDLASTLQRLTEGCGVESSTGGSMQLREAVTGTFEIAESEDRFPLQPARALLELRTLLDREDILVSDVGLHKLWIGRLWPAREPNTALIANGLAGMGFAVPAAIAAKLVHPDRKVVAVSGDGGFMMNMQELETAKRLGTPFVNVIWENRQFGSILWKQDNKFGRHFGVDFDNPDFVKLADAFGLPAWRISSVADYRERLKQALALDLPSVIVVPIDYSPDIGMAGKLGTETIRV